MAEKESAKQQGELRKLKAYCQTNAQQQRSGVSRTQDVTVLSGTSTLCNSSKINSFKGLLSNSFFGCQAPSCKFLPHKHKQLISSQTVCNCRGKAHKSRMCR